MIRLTFLTLVVALTHGSAALAAKVQHEMSPENLELHGFALAVRTRDDGSLLVTITRDVAKAHWPKRDGSLEIYGESERIVWCRLEPQRRKEKDNQLVGYQFIVSPKRLADTWFTLAEVQTANGEEDGEQVLGGGDFFRFSLGRFAESAKQNPPSAKQTR